MGQQLVIGQALARRGRRQQVGLALRIVDGKDRGMRDMARKIISSQKKEIAQFDAFLAKNGHGDTKPHAMPSK